MEITKVERINSIIKAAYEEFIEKGYEATSMDSIAKRASLSKGGVYHHFSSKDEILFAVNSFIMEPIVAMMRKAELADDSFAALKVFIHDYFSFWIERKRDLELNLLVISKLAQFDYGKKSYNEYLNNMKAFFEYMLIKSVEKKEIKNCKVNLISSLLFTILEGNLIKIAINNGNITSKILLDEIEDIILDSLEIKLTWY